MIPLMSIYFRENVEFLSQKCGIFTNLCYHFLDFGVHAEWHFFATSHMKSAGDGAGGTLKRLATKASLQRLYKDHILTAEQLYLFAVSEIKGMHFGFATLSEHEQEAKVLEDRLKRSRTVPGTHQLHSVVPVSTTVVEVKSFSNSASPRKERVALGQTFNPLPFGAISGYVTVAYDGSCWLGCVFNVNEHEHTITTTFLHPSISATSFVYPDQQDILDIDPSDILTRVQPSTASGRTYTLTKKEIQEALQTYLS